MENIQLILESKLNYWVAAILIGIGLFAMIGKRNLIKKLMGMIIFQAAIIMFYVSMAVKENADLPILPHDQTHLSNINPDDYSNPLPHVLMLTAIVVGVATLGLALATTQKIYSGFNTLEEPEINEILSREIEEEA